MDNAAAALYIDAGRFLDIDVLAGFYRRFEVLRVQEDRGGDDYGVDVARQQLAIILVHFGIFDGDLFPGLLDAVVDEASVESAAATRADQSDLHGRIGRCPADGGNWQQCGSVDQIPF